ncbi:MAG: response regulator [Candidatus Omnitrophica bacterium]|nr:response regulator [Candidatus Omnitrophota bacterium]
MLTASTPGLDSPRILVVDDEETVRVVSKRMLEACGLSVLCARDGAEGVEMFRERPMEITLVLLDMTMPRMSGEEAFREMRRIRPDVRVVLTSGYNEQEATTRFTGKGLAGFIQKPFTHASLLAKVREALESGSVS